MKCKYILTIGLFVFSQGLMADNNAEATAMVSGEVIKGLDVYIDVDITLPDLVLPDNSEKTSVELACPSGATSVVTYDNVGGNPFADGTASNNKVENGSANKAVGNETGVCLEGGIRGQPRYNVKIIPKIEIVDLATGIKLIDLNCLGTGSVTLSSRGSRDFYCGAKVEIDENAPLGTYSKVDAVSITVVYD